MKRKTTHTNTRPVLRWTLILSSLCVVVGVSAYIIHLHHKKLVAKTTSKAATAQNNYSSGANRPTSDSGATSQGGATDQQGQTTPVTTIQSQWATSGNITLESPVANATLAPNDVIEGTAKVAAIQYRLVDDQVGVVAQGSLNVVNGSFSGKIQFRHTAATGQLDIFSYNEQGEEVDTITIAVSFAR